MLFENSGHASCLMRRETGATIYKAVVFEKGINAQTRSR
jgi:hypothetical protein